MAAQDLQIQPRRSTYLTSPQVVSPQAVAHSGGAASESSSLLISALKRRWWAFILIACASAFAAREAMHQFGKETSRSTASLIQTGLPSSPEGGDVIKSMAPMTCAELIESFKILNKLLDSRGLDGISPSILQDLIETKTSRGSSLLSVELAWSNAADGVEMLNELCDIFVEEIADQRRRILRDHMQHVENALLQSRAQVADARQQIFEVQAEQQKVLEEGGLNSQRYESILSSVASTQLGVDEKRVEQLGVMQQIEAIQQKGKSLESQVDEVLSEYRTSLATKIANRLRRLREQITNTSQLYNQLNSLIADVEDFATSDHAPSDPQQWQVELYSLVTESGVPLPEDDIAGLATDFDSQLETSALKLKDIETLRQALDKQKDQLELSVIPIKNQIKMLEARLADYQKQADDIGEQLTGIGADQYGAYELRLEQAENQQKALTAQLDNMSQLEKCRVREWSVSVPASLETTDVSSNHNKVFALAFGLVGLVLSAPVLASEYYHRQDPPQVAFANALQLPVLADRILEDFSPRKRSRTLSRKLSDEQMEIVRMLALRIQQSAHSDGSVILFSSIDSEYSPAPLLASIAECLSQREEKVLIVDAVCPGRSRLPITNMISLPDDADANGHTTGQDYPDHPGLSEYFSSQCDSVSDMIRHTGCPGVDLISSGHAPFPREALASSSLTELVEHCRESYSMILVNSPAATASADLQMLAARADGVVLMATKEVHKNPRARAAVVDLIELGAPIIGVVA